MFCNNCGNQVPDGARFCENCGASLGSPAPAPQPVPQPTYYAPYDPTPVAAPAPVAMPEAPAAPVKKKKNPLPLILILAVVVVAAVVAAVLLLGKQTVYLATEIVSENMNGPVTTQRYEYDDEGRIVKYEYEMEYPESFEYSYDVKYECSYEYDKDGKLESATFEADDTNIEIEYIYEKGVLTGFECENLEEVSGATETEIKCDDEGRFKYIAFLSEEDEEIMVWEFKYHDNGIMKETRRSVPYSNMETVSRYNEDGKNIETATSWNGEQQYRTVTDYDDRGNVTLQKQYDSEDELTMSWEIGYTYKKDQLIGLTWNIEGQDSDGETIEAEISFECEWDGLECALTIDEIDGDEDALSSIGFGDEDIEILFEKDKHGNILKTEICVDGEAMTSNSTEYEEFKVSRDYSEPNLRTEPLYLLFLIM